MRRLVRLILFTFLVLVVVSFEVKLFSGDAPPVMFICGALLNIFLFVGWGAVTTKAVVAITVNRNDPYWPVRR